MVVDPASQLGKYNNNPKIWVCPKKRRGINYATAPGDFDPSITGFLSFGFNFCGVFGGDSKQFKTTSVPRPSDVITITECNGTVDPKEIGGSVGNGKADAAWFDWSYWSPNSYPNQTAPTGDENFRFQSQWKKHNQRVNITYVDGHSAAAKGRQLIWGQWYGTFGNTKSYDGNKNLSDPVSNAALDFADIAP